MPDPRFFTRKGPFRVREIAAWTGAASPSGSDLDRSVSDLSYLKKAGPNDLCYLSGPEHAAAAQASKAGACLTIESLTDLAPPDAVVLIAKDPQAAFSVVADSFYPNRSSPIMDAEQMPNGALIHPDAVIAEDVLIAPGAVIGPGAMVGARSRIGSMTTVGTGVMIGEDCDVGPNVSIGYCLVGSNVMIHPGVRIGQDGFGFVFDSVAGRHRKVPQLGRVIIQDDVEIGANTTIDRGTLDDTEIGEGCRIDNQVQIGHNVSLGKRCIIVSQVGLSGSCKIGDDVVIAGQVGLADHVRVGPKARIAAKSGVMRDIPPGTVVMGYPAKPIRTFWREVAALGRLTGKGKPS
ncbi:MAG: UDP-3-O-(3-hydroxymyristoyl)glucosamine N-acyltransferase [Rhodospirillaceae bacterium]|nr:UDP-3-O-(3-hydroxymyristoyl)glucosamine N-acyltransferase [Rhodospirillaceae bacterium]